MLSAVLTAMDANPGEAWVLRQACWTVSQLVPGLLLDPECSLDMMADTVDAILLAMRQHGRNAGLQKMAFRALAAIGSGAFSSLVDGTAVGLVTAAMRYHPEEPTLQSDGCMILERILELSLWTGHQMQNTEGLDAKFVSVDGVEVVVAAMRRHSDDAEVQRSACSSLAMVTWSNPLHRQAEAAAGAVEAAVQALLDHPRQPDTQAAAVKMLRHIVAEAADNGASIIARLVGFPRGYAALAHSAELLHFNEDSKWLLTKMPQNASMANLPLTEGCHQ